MAALLNTGRHQARDYALVLIGYRHAMRVSELVSLEWSQVNLEAGTIHINRCKGSQEGVHKLTPDAIKALSNVPRRNKFIFASERGGHISENNCHKIIASLGRVAGIPFPIHPHMLRHSKLTSLINRNVNAFLVQQFAGHKSIKSTLQYIHLAENATAGLSGD